MTDRVDLELELAEALRPAAAPDELWERVCGAACAPRLAVAGPAPIRRPAVAWASWPIAAIVTLMIAAATLWLVAKGAAPSLDLRQLAILELRDSTPLDMVSDDPARINERMGREAGLEPCVPNQARVRLLGARLIRKGDARVAAVSYRVGEETATLLVARADQSGDFGHGNAQWQARGQRYAVASSNATDAACRLCHAAL